jgi:ATP-dependent DNA helicase RecG
MTREELLEIIDEVQQRQSELDDVEVKAARGGTPKRLYASLSAFANRPGGGVLLFGLDETGDFSIVGVGNAQRLQEEITALASDVMEPTLRSQFTIEMIGGRTVVAVEITAISNQQKPCFYRTAGLQSGSYIRVGNSNRQMTDYEIFGYVSNREQPVFDENPVRDATLTDLDAEKLADYLDKLRRSRPSAGYLRQPDEEVLKLRRIAKDVDGTLRPTLAGLLMFGLYPQGFEPQFVITFLHFFGTTETEPALNGARFLDNRKFEGTIPEIIETAINHILASIRKSSLIEGLWRRDIPEYPVEALREAVVNAIAHRDYSQFVRGSYVQIRLFADRVEIQSPGGLYGNVTEDRLEEEQSTRNRVLVQLMEDYQLPGNRHLVENRGSGINAMLAAMRGANLEPPRFQDKRTSLLGDVSQPYADESRSHRLA